MDSIKKLAEASVNIIRNMTLLLRPSMLDDFGLVPALEWQAREVSKRTGIRVQVSAADVAGELPDDLKTCIYRVVQEALHNCARHAQARSVRVVVRQEEPRIVLSVEDDGRGFDARRVRGLGLVGMEERVRHLGGAFHVRSAPGARNGWMWSCLLRVDERYTLRSTAMTHHEPRSAFSWPTTTLSCATACACCLSASRT